MRFKAQGKCAELARFLMTAQDCLQGVYYIPGPGLSPEDIGLNENKVIQLLG